MIYLSIGSNLNSKFGNRLDNITKAVSLLKDKKIKIKKISNFFESPSYPNKKNPKFNYFLFFIGFPKWITIIIVSLVVVLALLCLLLILRPATFFSGHNFLSISGFSAKKASESSFIFNFHYIFMFGLVFICAIFSFYRLIV